MPGSCFPPPPPSFLGWGEGGWKATLIWLLPGIECAVALKVVAAYVLYLFLCSSHADHLFSIESLYRQKLYTHIHSGKVNTKCNMNLTL